MCKENLRKVELYFNKSFEDIFNENRKYISITINRFYSRYKNSIWIEDIEQCGMIGLSNAIETLNLDMIDSFTAHIITCIRREILYFENEILGNTSKTSKNTVSLNNYSDSPSVRDEKCMFLDIIKSKIDLEKEVTQKIDITNAINRLRPAEQDLVHYIMDGFTQKEIAAIFNIAEPTVTQRVQAIYRRLRFMLKSSYSFK